MRYHQDQIPGLWGKLLLPLLPLESLKAVAMKANSPTAQTQLPPQVELGKAETGLQRLRVEISMSDWDQPHRVPIEQDRGMVQDHLE